MASPDYSTPGLPSPEQADMLLQAGAITPDQHSQIVASAPSTNNVTLPVQNVPYEAVPNDAVPGGFTAAPRNIDVGVSQLASVPGSLTSSPYGVAPQLTKTVDGIVPPEEVSQGGSLTVPMSPGSPQNIPISAAKGTNNNKPASSPGSIPGDGQPSGFVPADPLEARYYKREQEARKDLTKAEDNIVKDETAIQADKVKRAEVDAAGQAREQELRGQHLQQTLKTNADIDASNNKRLADADAALKEAADAKVDPNHYFKEMSTPVRIASVFALALGALGGATGGAGHGVNAAVNSINTLIERDIDAQKTNINAKFKTAEGKRGLLHDALAVTSDKREADLLAYKETLNQVIQEREAQLAGLAPGEAKNNGQRVVDGLKGKQQEAEFAIREMAQKKADAEKARAAAAANAGHAKDLERTKKITELAHSYGLKGMSTEGAMRRATAEVTGQDLGKGEFENVPTKGGNKAADQKATTENQLATVRSFASTRKEAAKLSTGNHLPNFLTSADAMNQQRLIDEHNSRARAIVAGTYAGIAGGNIKEGKGQRTLEHQESAYMWAPGMSEAQMAAADQLLEERVRQAGSAPNSASDDSGPIEGSKEVEE